MDSKPEGYNMTKMDRVIRSFGIIIPLLYVGLGTVILWNSAVLFPNLPAKYSLPAGSLFIVYGLFRGYRVFQKIFNNN